MEANNFTDNAEARNWHPFEVSGEHLQMLDRLNLRKAFT